MAATVPSSVLAWGFTSIRTCCSMAAAVPWPIAANHHSSAQVLDTSEASVFSPRRWCGAPRTSSAARRHWHGAHAGGHSARVMARLWGTDDEGSSGGEDGAAGGAVVSPFAVSANPLYGFEQFILQRINVGSENCLQAATIIIWNAVIRGSTIN
jgi:hypothetical protein